MLDGAQSSAVAYVREASSFSSHSAQPGEVLLHVSGMVFGAINVRSRGDAHRR